MSSLDGLNLFGSGPHSIRAGSWERSTVRRYFSGLNGELLLQAGVLSRELTQTGRLQADTADALHLLIENIEALEDGKKHTLIDAHGRTYGSVVIESFKTTTPALAGRGVFCDYSISYRELPS